MPQSASVQPLRSYNSPRQQERRDNILATARRLLTERGYEGVTMDVLATEAGVAKKTLYNAFGGKDALLLEAVGEVIHSYRSNLQVTGFEAITQSRHHAINQVLSNPSYAHAMTIALLQADAQHALVRLLLADSVAFTRRELERDAGRIDNTTGIEDLATQIVAQGWGMVVLHLKGVITDQQFREQSEGGLKFLLHAATTDRTGH